MGLKKMYYYFYYKIYKTAVSISDDILNEWKPYVAIGVLKILLILQFFNWYSVLTKKVINFSNPLLVGIPILLVMEIFDYFYFLHKDKWKNYFKEFESFDKSHKNKGGIVSFFLIFFIIVSLILSFYFLSEVKWKNYGAMDHSSPALR